MCTVRRGGESKGEWGEKDILKLCKPIDAISEQHRKNPENYVMQYYSYNVLYHKL